MTSSPDPGRRLAAVWFADIVGYTTLSSQDEDGALEVVAAFQRIAEEVVREHAGRVVKYIGDAALAEFASTDGAIRSALALMERFIDDEAVRPYGSTLRVGVNVGEVISSPDGDIYGDGVNLASRLQNQAAPGQVIASEAVHAQIRQRPVFRTEPLGQRAVKGIADPVNLYSVTLQQAEGGGRPITASSLTPSGTRGGGGGGRARLVGGAIAGVVAVAALWLLDPGGVMSGLFGREVAVTEATFPRVDGGMDVAGDVTVAFTGAVDPASADDRSLRLLDPWGDPVPADLTVAGDGGSATLHPRSPLAYASRYVLEVGPGLVGAAGRPVGGEAGFRTELTTQPLPSDVRAVSSRIADGLNPDAVPPAGPVEVAFEGAVEVRSAGEGSLRLEGADGAVVAASLRFEDGGLRALFEPASPLTRGGRYRVLVGSGVVTASGIPIRADTLPFRVAAGAPARTAPSGGGATAPQRRRSGPATLNLQASPAAAHPFLKVVVDRDTLGPPPIRGVSLEEGRAHTVTLVGVPDLSAYTIVVYRQEITPEPGQVLNVDAEITAFGSIDVVSEPAGIVFVDGRQAGRTPLAGYPVTAGVIHRLEIRPTAADAETFDAFTGEFRVEALEWKSLGRLSLPVRSPSTEAVR